MPYSESPLIRDCIDRDFVLRRSLCIRGLNCSIGVDVMVLSFELLIGSHLDEHFLLYFLKCYLKLSCKFN